MDSFFMFLLEVIKASEGSHVPTAEIIVIAAGLVSSMGLGGLFVYSVAWLEFRRRSFFDQMVIGVNVLEPAGNGKWVLTLRTLREDNLSNILDNPVLERMVEKAAKRCTEKRPILQLKNKEDHALLLTKIQNVVSSIFAKEYLQMMVGHPSIRVWVDFVVTCEKYGGLKATKIRVIVFFMTDLPRYLDDEFVKHIIVEEPHHVDRIKTFRVIARTNIEDKSVVAGSVEIPIHYH